MRLTNFIKIFLVALILTTTFFTTIGNVTAFAANKDKEYGGNSGGSQYSAEKSGNYSLTGNHTYSDLYASYIFSKQSGKNAASANIAYSDLKQYPIGGDDDSEEEKNKALYGQMKTPFSENEPQEEGLQLTSYIKTLHDYDYLVPSPKDSDKDSISTFFKAMWPGSSGDDDRARLTLRTVLDTAAKGARFYDSFVGLIDAFEKVSVSFNIPTLFKTIVEDGNQKVKDDRSNFLNSIVKNTLGYMGLTDGAIKVIQYFVWIVILTMFIATLILGLATSQAKQKSITNLKRYGLRILVIILTIPTLLMLHSVMDEIGDSFNKTAKNSPTQFNSNYVVDTLEWAATSNLNLGLINPSGNIDKSGKTISDFKPTPENVGRLMNIVNTRAQNAGMLGKDDQQSAASLISQIANQKTVDVNDYFGMISSNKANDPNIAATNVPLYNANATISRGDTDKAYSPNDKDINGNIKFNINSETKNPMFFVENQIEDKTKKGFTKSIESNMGEKETMGDYQFRTKENTPAKKAREKVTKDYSDTRWVRISNNVVPFSDKSGPIKYFNVKPQDPTQFLYGAIDSGSATQAYTSFDNFIDGPNSMQRNNVVKGTQYTVKDLNDKKLGKFAKDAYNNSLRIALMNRYGGITQSSGSGNVKSLSTQSVAFLLQTSAQNQSSLKYDGQNAVPNDEGTGKNSGKNGTGFVRYTIPNTGYSDLISKAGAINIVWLVSGIVAVFAFINLLRAPILGAIVKMFKGFLGAFFTGNIAALLTYMVYYVALRASFIFVKAAIITGSAFATKLVGSFGVLKSLTSMSKFVPGSATNVTIIIVALVVGVILLFPIASFTIGGKPKKLGLLGIMIMLPYLVAESLEASFEKMYSRIYGKAPGGMLGNNIKGINPMTHMKDTGRSIGKVGKGLAGAGVGFATGGAGFLASAGVAASGILGKGAEAIGESRETKHLNDNLSRDGGDGSNLGKVSKFSRFGKTMNSIYDKYRPDDEDLNNQNAEIPTNSNEFDKEIDENGDIREALGNNDTKGDPNKPKDPDNFNAAATNGTLPNDLEKNEDEDKDLTPEEKEKLAIATNDSNKAIEGEKDSDVVENQNSENANTEEENTENANVQNGNIENVGTINNVQNVENINDHNADIDKQTDGDGNIIENGETNTENANTENANTDDENIKDQHVDNQTVDTNATDQGEINDNIVKDGNIQDQNTENNNVNDQNTENNNVNDQNTDNDNITDQTVDNNKSSFDANRDGSAEGFEQAAGLAGAAAAGQALNNNLTKDPNKAQLSKEKIEKLEKVKEVQNEKVKESKEKVKELHKEYKNANDKIEASIKNGEQPNINDLRAKSDLRPRIEDAVKDLNKNDAVLKSIESKLNMAQKANKPVQYVNNVKNEINNSRKVENIKNMTQAMKNADNGRMAAGAKQVKDSLTSKDLRDGLRELATQQESKKSSGSNNSRSNLTEQANQQKSLRQQKQMLDELRKSKK